MSRYNLGAQAKTLRDLQDMKAKGEKITMVTCYDAAFASLIDKTDMDAVLVGDSLGNVILGHNDTIPVTLDDMIHHCRAVGRILKKPFLACDMPFGTYQTPEMAMASAVRLIQEGQAQAVKLEGGRSFSEHVRRIVELGIPVIGHLGLTPQSVHAMSGYKVQGRDDEAQKALVLDALALEQAGAALLVLELVPASLAEKISQALRIPTIGIGAGPDCDGQVLVLHDLLGFDDQFKPRFLKHYANIGRSVVDALSDYIRDVKDVSFPTQEHSFK